VMASLTEFITSKLKLKDATDARGKCGESGRRTRPLSPRMAGLFRLLPDPVCAEKPRLLDTATTSIVSVEAVETWFGAIRGAHSTGRGRRARRANGGQRARSVATCRITGPTHRTAQCLFRLAWHSTTVRHAIAESAEPQYTRPVRTVV